MTRSGLTGIVVAAAMTFAPIVAQASTSIGDIYSSFWVFGDSLSDPGNLSAATGGAQPGPAYYEGRFSSGPVWAEYVAAEFTISGNFAFGGAEALDDPAQLVPSLGDQVGLFAATIDPALLGDNDLAAIWSGANDLLGTIGTGDLWASMTVAFEAATMIADQIQVLSSLGIDEFLVFNLPDLGLSPLYQLAQPHLAAEASLITQVFNLVLDFRLDQLRATGLSIIEIDIFTLFNEMLADPVSFGVTETLFPCLLGTSICDDPETRAFYDLVHPSGTIHAAIAEEVISAATIPLPASLAFLMMGLAGLGLIGRRRTA